MIADALSVLLFVLIAQVQTAFPVVMDLALIQLQIIVLYVGIIVLHVIVIQTILYIASHAKAGIIFYHPLHPFAINACKIV